MDGSPSKPIRTSGSAASRVFLRLSAANRQRRKEAPRLAKAILNGLIVNRNETNVRMSLENLVPGSMSRPREQLTQSSAPVIDVRPTEQKSEEMGEADLSRSPSSQSDLTAVAGALGRRTAWRLQHSVVSALRK